MKKLLIIVFILFLCSSASADNVCLTEHYSALVDARSSVSGKGASMFDYDSLTLDLYLSDDSTTGYLNITTCISGIFFNDAMNPVRIATVNGQMYLVSGNGTNLRIERDAESQDIWIEYGQHMYRMRRVEPLSIYADIQ